MVPDEAAVHGVLGRWIPRRKDQDVHHDLRSNRRSVTAPTDPVSRTTVARSLATGRNERRRLVAALGYRSERAGTLVRPGLATRSAFTIESVGDRVCRRTRRAARRSPE